MIHITTYKTPNGSKLGAFIEAINNGKTVYAQTLNRAQLQYGWRCLRAIMSPKSSYYIGATGVVKKTQVVTVREWYGIGEGE